MPDSPNATGTTWEIHPTAPNTRRPAIAPQHLRAVSLGSALLRLRICGDVNSARLRAATEKVLGEHSALRQRLQSAGSGLEVYTAQHTTGTPTADVSDAVPLARLTVSSDGTYLELR